MVLNAREEHLWPNAETHIDRSSCIFAHSDMGLRCLLTETQGTEECTDETE